MIRRRGPRQWGERSPGAGDRSPHPDRLRQVGRIGSERCGAGTFAAAFGATAQSGLYDPPAPRYRTLEVAGQQVPWTEVVSVGMERLAADPLSFARRDWEYFSFLVRRITHRAR